MPRKTTTTYFAPQGKTQACYVQGCAQAGEYKAPKRNPHSREPLDEYIWLCLEHVREHNKAWDYFEGMDTPDIEAFMRDAVTGHRPTWSREGRLREHYFILQDKLYEFLNGRSPPPVQPRIPAKTRKALAALEMDYPYTRDQLKTRYRALAKKYHPDLHKGDKNYEENFKYVTVAYKYLMEQLK